jgi:hypothetical protein
MLDEIVSRLREIERRTGIERTLAIGELILKRFFGGDSAVWRERRRNKNNSIRRLARRKDCPFCRSALNEAVAIYVASCDLPCVRTFGHIGASHVAQVLPLPHEQREPLLQRAELERWSVRTLRAEVVSLRRVGGERRGRPSITSQARAMSALRSCLNRLEQCVDRVDKCTPLSVESLLELRSLASTTSRVGARLREYGETGSSLTLCPPQLVLPEDKRSA